MTSHRSPGVTRRLGATVLAAWLAAPGSPAFAAVGGSADAVGRAPASWWSVGLLAGATQPDPSLADYQWDARPGVAWGAEVLVGSGPVAAGARMWRSGSTQLIDPAGPSVSSSVHLTSWDLVTQGRVATWWATELMGTASTGILTVSYDPDRVTVAPGGSGTALVVDLEPIAEWNGAAGVALRRALRGRWSAALEVDRRLFRMDTAHRSGSQIVTGRQTFGDWTARLGLAWVGGRR